MNKKLKQPVKIEGGTVAEQHLLELVRHEDTQNFTIEISVDNEQWHVKITDHDSGIYADGSGPSFAQAWYDVVDPRLRNLPIDEEPPRLRPESD
jgi:hypothetical protein